RQVILDAGGRRAVGNVLVDLRAGRIAFEGFAEAAAEGGAAFLVHGKFARRQHADFRHGEQGALRVRVEVADRLDFVVEEIDAEGQGGAGRVEIDEAAAYAVFAGRDDLGHMFVAGGDELGAQAFDVELVAFLEEEGVRGQVLRR